MMNRTTDAVTIDRNRAESYHSEIFDIVDDPLVIVDGEGSVVDANKAAHKAFVSLRLGAPLPVVETQVDAFRNLLHLCEATSEPVAGVILVAGPDREIIRHHCRCRTLLRERHDSNQPRILVHLHAAGINRRFSLLAQRMMSARRVMDERRRREWELRALLNEREALLARLEADAKARSQAERERDEILARLYHAGQDERHRLARALHDHAGQQVVTLNLGLNKLARHLTTQEALAEHQTLLRQAQGIFDSLRYVILKLRPPALDEFGFATALRAMVQDWSELTEVKIEFEVTGRECPLADEVAITLYRITQEALTNVSKHGGAIETVAVILRFDADFVTLTVNDDGNGFDACPAELRRMASRGRLGLAGMRERLGLVGGTLKINSSQGHGTTVVARVDVSAGIPRE